MRSSIFLPLLGFYLCLICINCGPNGKEKTNNKSNSISLSQLPFDFHFGMSNEVFFNHASSINKKRVIFQNSSNKAVNLIQVISNQQLQVNVIPVFEQDRMVNLAFNYKTILVSNPDTSHSLDKLFKEIATFYQSEYGKKFTSIDDWEDGGIALVKSDGSYSISIFRNSSDSSVTVLFKMQSSN